MELYHWGLRRGEEAKKHKYAKRELVKTKNGKNIYRYFYGDEKKESNKERIKTQDAMLKSMPSTFKGHDIGTQSSSQNQKSSKLTNENVKGIVPLIFVKKETIDNLIDKAQDLFDKGDSSNKDEWHSETEHTLYETTEYENVEYEDKIYEDGRDYVDNYVDNNKSKTLLNYDSATTELPSDHDYTGRVHADDGTSVYFNDTKDLKDYYEEHGSDVEKQLLKDYGIKKDPSTPKEDMSEINERYEEGAEYQNNCYSCTLAYDLRRRGFDVEAIPDFDGASVPEIMSLYEGMEESDCTFVATGGTYGVNLFTMMIEFQAADQTACENIVKDLEKNEEGANGMLMVAWVNGAAHSIAWEINNGELVLRDCQSNTEYRGDDIYNEVLCYTSCVEYIRTDDKKLSKNVLNYTKDN